MSKTYITVSEVRNSISSPVCVSERCVSCDNVSEQEYTLVVFVRAEHLVVMSVRAVFEKLVAWLYHSIITTLWLAPVLVAA